MTTNTSTVPGQTSLTAGVPGKNNNNGDRHYRVDSGISRNGFNINEPDPRAQIPLTTMFYSSGSWPYLFEGLHIGTIGDLHTDNGVYVYNWCMGGMGASGYYGIGGGAGFVKDDYPLSVVGIVSRNGRTGSGIEGNLGAGGGGGSYFSVNRASGDDNAMGGYGGPGCPGYLKIVCIGGH